jgi:hypothetical protein
MKVNNIKGNRIGKRLLIVAGVVLLPLFSLAATFDGYYIDLNGDTIAIVIKVKKVSLIAQYDYDDRGFRIRKNDRVHNVITWYLRDLSGNILATYTKETGSPEIDEVPLYGTSRIGMAKFHQFTRLTDLGKKQSSNNGKRKRMNREIIIYGCYQ